MLRTFASFPYCFSRAANSPGSSLCVLIIIIDLQELGEFHPLLLAMKVVASGIGYLLRCLIREDLMISQSVVPAPAASALPESLSEM